MNEKTLSIVQKSIQILVGVLTVALGVVFIAQTQRLYAIDGAYSEVIIGKYFAEFSWLVFLWLACVVASGIFSCVYPLDEKADKYVDKKKTLARLKARFPMQNADFVGAYADDLKKLNARTWMRRGAWIAVALVCLVSSAICFAYLVNVNNFPSQDVTDEVEKMVVKFLPYLLGVFCAAIAAYVFETVSVNKELKSAKTLVAESAKATFRAAVESYVLEVKNDNDGSQSTKVKHKKQEQPKTKWQLFREKVEKVTSSNKFMFAVRGVIGVACIVFIVVGLLNGGAESVLGKAILLCKE